jgi:hypothetical protein
VRNITVKRYTFRAYVHSVLNFTTFSTRELYRFTSYIEFEGITAMVMKSSIFWDITPCSPLEVNRRLGGTCRFHLQGRIISQGRNQSESWWQAPYWFLAWLFIWSWRWRLHVAPKRSLTFNGLHGVISQKIELFTPYRLLYLQSCIKLHNYF